ncbi:hypothetical protein PI125_g21363 [Phytophthora idaei]|nr:hypothetical protein PI125_g21363 [Phytophthora idaei]
MAREPNSAVPATPMKGGASQATGRDAARTSTRMATIRERSVSFEDSEDEDSRATDEALGYGDDREESTPGSRDPSRETSLTNFRLWRGRMQLTTTGVKKTKKINRRRRLCATRTDLLCVLPSKATLQRRTKSWRGVSRRCSQATGLCSSTLARRVKLLGVIYATSWLTQLTR